MTYQKIASPLRGWFGGKCRLTRTLIPLIPPHHCYAEVFAGAAWLLFHKPQGISKTEVLNDINADIVNLYRIVQHHEPELLRLAGQMLPSRDEYLRQQAMPPDSLTDVQRALRFLYLHRLSFGGRITEQYFGARRNRPPRFNPQKLVQELADSRRRLQGVLLERLPYGEFVRRYDAPDTFFYLDPPYVSTKQGAYANDAYFGMVQFLRLAALVRPPFVFFSSTRSELTDYLDFIVSEKVHNWQDWAGCQCVSLTAALNYQARYEDNMLYKF